MNDLPDQVRARECSRTAASQPGGCAFPAARRAGAARGTGLVLLVLSFALGCDDASDPVPPVDATPPLPAAMELNGTASIELEDGRTADCTIFLHIEVEGDEEEVDGGLVYRGTAGGDAIRTVLQPDDSGFSFWPHLHSGATLRATLDSIEVMADGHDTVSVRFYQGIMHFAGVRTGPGEANGEWTCAPLDLDSGGWLDTAVVASGTWTLTPAEPFE